MDEKPSSNIWAEDTHNETLPEILVTDEDDLKDTAEPMGDKSSNNIWAEDTCNESPPETLVKDEDLKDTAEQINIREMKIITETPLHFSEGSDMDIAGSVNLQASPVSASDVMDDDSYIILPTPEKKIGFQLSPVKTSSKGKYQRPPLFDDAEVRKELKFDDEIEQNKDEEQRENISLPEFKTNLQQSSTNTDVTSLQADEHGTEGGGGASQIEDTNDWKMNLSSSLESNDVENEEKEKSPERTLGLLVQDFLPDVIPVKNKSGDSDDSESELPATQVNPDLYTSPVSVVDDSDFSDDEIGPSQAPTQPVTAINDLFTPECKDTLKIGDGHSECFEMVEVPETIEIIDEETSEMAKHVDVAKVNEFPETQKNPEIPETIEEFPETQPNEDDAVPGIPVLPETVLMTEPSGNVTIKERSEDVPMKKLEMMDTLKLGSESLDSIPMLEPPATLPLEKSMETLPKQKEVEFSSTGSETVQVKELSKMVEINDLQEATEKCDIKTTEVSIFSSILSPQTGNAGNNSMEVTTSQSENSSRSNKDVTTLQSEDSSMMNTDVTTSQSEDSLRMNEDVTHEKDPRMLPPSCPLKKTHLNRSPKKPDTVFLKVASSDLKESQFIDNTSLALTVPYCFGTFSGPDDLSEILKSLRLPIDDEKLKSLLSPSDDSEEKTAFEGTCRVFIKDNQVFQKYFAVDYGKFVGNLSEVEVSPANSNSTLSTKTSSFGSIPSGEMADVSSSSKSLSSSNSSSIASQSKIRKSILSQEAQMGISSVKTPFLNSDTLTFENAAICIHGGTEIDTYKGKKDNLEVDAQIKSLAEQSSSELQPDDKGSQDDFRTPIVALTHIQRSSKNILVKPHVTTTKSKRGRKRKYRRSLSAPTNNSSDSLDEPPKRLRSVNKKSASGSIEHSTKKYEVFKKEFHDLIDDRKCVGGDRDLIRGQEENTDSESHSMGILPGIRVMARWTDGYYYPGIVQSQELDGKWCIGFDDGPQTVSEKNLLKISTLKPGTSVLAQSQDGYFDCGTVKSHFRDGEKFGYIIEHETGLTKKYSRSSVILSTSQAKSIENKSVTPPSFTINLDNIVCGKRKRKSAETSESKSSLRGKRRRKPDSNLDSTESSVNESKMDEKCIIQKVKRQLKKSEKLQHVKSGQARSMKSNSHEVGENNAVSSEIVSLDTSEKCKVLSGPTPVRSSKMFIRYAFLLSCTVRKSSIKKIFSSASDSETSESCDSRQPFDKENLCAEILSGGGIVLETFEDALKTKRKVLLLASGPLRTIKYIQCVAANIPCIKYYWVYDCATNKGVFDYSSYLLSTGLCIIENKFLEWHSKTNIFEGLKIVLTSEEKSDFVNTWTPVLLSAKADLVQKWNLPTFSVPGMSFNVDLIITNSSCPKNIVTAAKRRKIPIVSSEWMIQSIVSGKQLSYTAHPKFRHDFREE